MDRIGIKNLSKKGLEEEFARLGVEGYRATQVFRWLYKSGSGSFDEMTDLPLDLRNRLKPRFHISRPTLLDSKRSSLDGTAKYLFKLEDANTIESVFLPEAKRSTICLSSQVGCKYGCSFCASAPFGFRRNLTVQEILDEIIAVRRNNKNSKITNIVFMGIGEPLDNYDNVLAAVRIINDKDAFNIGARKITVSTCGLIPGIRRLENERLQVELSVSLHSADDDARSGLVPINKVYPLKDLLEACKDYIKATGRVITFEYVLIRGVNCSAEDALKLGNLLKGIKCKVNAISYNQIGAKDYRGPSADGVKTFVRTLKGCGINVTHRKSKGEDIDAGCGQLRISNM